MMKVGSCCRVFQKHSVKWTVTETLQEAAMMAEAMKAQGRSEWWEKQRNASKWSSQQDGNPLGRTWQETGRTELEG